MRALRALLVLALLPAAAGFGAGCSERPHANPFDPANPKTGGRPAGFVALAGNGHAELHWTVASAPGLVGYEVLRSLAPDAGFVSISSVLPPAVAGFNDVGLLNGTDHYYRLHYVFDRGRGPLYASDVATPGPVTPWVTDYSTPALERLTADGRHIAERIQGAVVFSAGAVDVDPATGAVWTCDPDFGEVTIYRPSNGTLEARGVSNPAAVEVDPVDHSVWVGDDGFDQLVHFASDGSPGTPPTAGPFEGPIGIAIDPADQSVWVCERTGSRVRHMSGAGLPLTNSFVVNPSRVALDVTTGDAWVTSTTRGRIVRLSPSGVRADSVSSLAGPLAIAVDATRGRIWVTDPDAGLVTALRRDGSTEFTTGGLAGAYDLALDAATGEVWVTAYDAGTVIRIAPDGHILRQLGGFASPYGIALDPGTGPVPRTAAGLTVRPRR
jgi:DNA-binding beta-propeller fold protein YncE